MKHNQHAKPGILATIARGSGGMPPGKFLKVDVLKLHFKALSVDR